MPTLDEIKGYLKNLSAEDKLALGSYATAEGTKEKQSSEELKLLQSLPTPITDSDKAFIEKNKDNKNIKRDKIKFTENTIELDGLKFPRKLVQYDDVKNNPGLINKDFFNHNNNVYQYNGHSYFTFDAVKQLITAGNKIPSKDQWQKAADLFGGDYPYSLLGQLLNYPLPGRRSYNDYERVGAVTEIWTCNAATNPLDKNRAFSVLFTYHGTGSTGDTLQSYACSLVFLQD